MRRTVHIYGLRGQVIVSYPQISQTAGCCRSTDILQLYIAYPQISQTAGCCIHRYLTQLDIADPQISQRAECCRSTDISDSWISIIHRFCRHLNATHSRALEKERTLQVHEFRRQLLYINLQYSGLSKCVSYTPRDAFHDSGERCGNICRLLAWKKHLVFDSPDKGQSANWHRGCATLTHWRSGAACNLKHETWN